MLSIVILSYNRCGALKRTLDELGAQGLLSIAQVIVVDNGSGDGSGEMVRSSFPGVSLLELKDNRGVTAFNVGAERATGDLLLVLDDDSWPDAEGLADAMSFLEHKPTVAGVALLPKHPVTRVEEWRHGRAASGGWTLMGCGNLVRMEAWRRVEGYEGGFFLYRNDTDLALKLLSAGYDVWFDPAWIVWHDSPAAAAKGDRWLFMATRNWGWLARRHGRGVSKWMGMFAGFAWASRLAGLSARRQWRVLKGVLAALCLAPPKMPSACVVDGKAFRELVARQVRRERG